jgi:hypothetical protein
VSSSLIVIPAYGVWIQDTDLNSNLSVLLDGSVKYGLTPSAGTGLTIAIATGKAVIEGHEITDPTGSAITVPASTSSSIWLQLIKNSSGQVTSAQYTVSATQPSDSILLCNFVSGTSSITSVTDARTIGAVLQTYDQNANPVTRMIIPGGNTQGNTLIKIYEGLLTKNNTLDDGSGNATITGVLTNTVGGDLSGTALNAVTIAKLQGQTLTLGTPNTNQVIAWNGSAWVNTSLSFVSGVSSLNGLTGALTIQSPNGTLNVSTSSPYINLDFNLAHSNSWTALQTFPDIEVITGIGQALALGVLYNTVGTSQLDSPNLYFVGTGYYNTSGGLATMPWQFYNNITGGSSTAQSASIFTINPPNNTAFNSFKIFNSSFVLANIIGGDSGFQVCQTLF